jgi:hypothetical protein
MTWKRFLAVVVVLAVMAPLGWRIVRQGDRIERRLLRTGGGIVQAAAQRPRRTLAVFGATVGVIWLGIGVAALLQRCEGSSEPSPNGRDIGR